MPPGDQGARVRRSAATARDLRRCHQAPSREAGNLEAPRRAGPARPRPGGHYPPRHSYEPRNFTRHFATRCRIAGVRYITPHGVRRTCASLLAALDVHPRVAMRILRHSKITVTMEIYTEVPDQAARDALRRPGEQFDS
jgi:integrase